MAPQPHVVVSRVLRLWSAGAAELSALVGLAVLIGGWALGIDALKSVLPGLTSMKANTALCFVLSGGALWALRDEGATPRVRAAATAATGLVSLLAGLTLVESLTGQDLWIDELLFRDPPATATGLPGGRMSPLTALCFILIAGGLVGLYPPALFRMGQRLAVAAGFLALLNVVAYAYSVRSLTLAALRVSYTEMALHTAVMVVVLSVGIAAARPGRGATGILVKAIAGGIVARWLLPVALVGPLVIGAVRLWGERQGYYGFEFGLALMAVSTLSIFSALVWGIAARLHRTDVQRQKAEAELRQVNAQLEEQVKARTAALAAYHPPSGRHAAPQCRGGSAAGVRPPGGGRRATGGVPHRTGAPGRGPDAD